MKELLVEVGDVLESRHSKRKGRLAKVIYVGDDHVTLETVRNADGATVNTVGHTSDVSIKRLGKDYKHHEDASTVRTYTFDSEGTVHDITNYLSMDGLDYAEPETEEDDEPLTEDEVHVLDSALAEVGYHFVPDLQTMLDTIDEAVGDDWDEYLDPREAVELTLAYITEL